MQFIVQFFSHAIYYLVGTFHKIAFGGCFNFGNKIAFGCKVLGTPR